MFKQTEKNGRAVQFSRQRDVVLKKWVLSQLKREGKKITEPVLNTFLESTGDDMELISQELEKLLCYTMEKDVITAEDVKAVGVPAVGNHIFDMITAMAAKNQKKAMALYDQLLALKEPPMRILFLIARQFQLMVQMKDMKELRKSSKEMGSAGGLSPFIAEKYAKQAESFSKKQLLANLEECALAEEMVKTGKWIDRVAVELLIIKFSRK
jgi:DNA polymerase-3 subunit delta